VTTCGSPDEWGEGDRLAPSFPEGKTSVPSVPVPRLSPSPEIIVIVAEHYMRSGTIAHTRESDRSSYNDVTRFMASSFL